MSEKQNSSWITNFKIKWEHLHLTMRALLPLIFVTGFSLMIGGFVSIPVASMDYALKQISPSLTELEKNYIKLNYEKAINGKIGDQTYVSETFLRNFANEIQLTYSFLKKTIQKLPIISPSKFEDQYLFGQSLYSNKKFSDALPFYIKFIKSSDDDLVNKVDASNKKQYGYTFFFDDIKDKYYLIKNEDFDLSLNLNNNELVEATRALPFVKKINYPRLKNMYTYTTVDDLVDTTSPYEYLTNYNNDISNEIFFFNTINKIKKEKDDLDTKVIVGAILGTVGSILFLLASGYVYYAYKVVTKKNYLEQ